MTRLKCLISIYVIMLLSFISNAGATEQYSGEQILLCVDVKHGKNLDIRLKAEAESSSVIISPMDYKRYTYKCSEGSEKLTFDVFGVGELNTSEMVKSVNRAPISTITLKGAKTIFSHSIHIDFTLADGWQASLIEHTRNSIIVTFKRGNKETVSITPWSPGPLPFSPPTLSLVSLLSPVTQETKMTPIPEPNHYIAYTPDTIGLLANKPVAEITGVNVDVRERRTILSIKTKGTLLIKRTAFISNTIFSVSFVKVLPK